MYVEWAGIDFSQLMVDDVEAGTELIEFDLEQARLLLLQSTIGTTKRHSDK